MTLQLKNPPPLHPLAVEEIEEILSLLKSGQLAYCEYEHGPDGLSHNLAGWKLIKDAGRIDLEYDHYPPNCSILTYKSKRKLEKKLIKNDPFNWGAADYAQACWGLTHTERLLLLGAIPLDSVVQYYEQIKANRIP